MPKTIEENFRDWESEVFGFGYGTGEPYTLAALKTFMEVVGTGESPERSHVYDYKKLEAALTPTVAWLLINTLARHPTEIVEYGTSPRFGWLTDEGKKLHDFVASKSLDELLKICLQHGEDYSHCGPSYCNCGPHGYEHGRKCNNPFWRNL